MQQFLNIHTIPAILLGEHAQKVFLFVHGKCGSKEEAIPFAHIACVHGYQVVGIDLPGHGARREDGRELTPHEVLPELSLVQDYLQTHWQSVSLCANSIGAWFCMQAFPAVRFERCLFVSPIVDMYQLIVNRMNLCGVDEACLRAKQEIPTPFGEPLSLSFYDYAKNHPVTRWCHTDILYGGLDDLTPRKTITDFCARFSCTLTVMEQGEHWFHTEDQLAFLTDWTRKTLA